MFPWRYDRAWLQSGKVIWPRGFVDFVLTHGQVQDGDIVLTPHARSVAIGRYYSDGSRFAPAVRGMDSHESDSPSPNMRGSGGRLYAWAKSGFQRVDQEEFDRRRSICKSCEHWDAEALFNRGKCRKCGCSQLKLWMASARCPDAPHGGSVCTLRESAVTENHARSRSMPMQLTPKRDE